MATIALRRAVAALDQARATRLGGAAMCGGATAAPRRSGVSRTGHAEARLEGKRPSGCLARATAALARGDRWTRLPAAAPRPAPLAHAARVRYLLYVTKEGPVVAGKTNTRNLVSPFRSPVYDSSSAAGGVGVGLRRRLGPSRASSIYRLRPISLRADGPLQPVRRPTLMWGFWKYRRRHRCRSAE